MPEPRTPDQITEAEVEAAANVYLASRTAGDPGTTWRKLMANDIIAHQEVGYLVTMMLHAAEVVRCKNQEA